MTRLLIIFAVFALTVPPAHCEEPARAFLDGLRQRGYHDVAMDYLNQMQTSRLAPAELKTNVLYEKALLLIDSSRRQRDAAARSKQVDQAQAWLEQFIQTQSKSTQLNAARSRLGSLIVERARMKIQDSKTGNTTKLLEEARALYAKSFEVFGALQARVDQQLSEIPKVLNTRDRKEALLIERRKQLRADFLQTELFAAAIREELADILPAGSTEQSEVLLEAAEMYDGIYKNYRTRLAGRYARMYQGRCFRRLGKTRQALGYFGELLDLTGESDDLLVLKAKSLEMAMEAWLSPGEKKYLEAIRQATKWFEETPADKQRDAVWISIRYYLARAYKMQADDAKTVERVDESFVRQSLEAAKKELRLVASEAGEHQEAAQRLLKQLGGEAVEAEVVVPTTFMAAQMVGKEAMDAIAPAAKIVKDLQSQLTTAKESDKASLTQRLDQAQQRLLAVQTEAIDNYRLAIELADDETPQSNVNLVRYFLCYVYFIKGDYFDAALMGDFVARRYPDSPGSRQCAKISMACYQQMTEDTPAEDRDFEITRLTSATRYLADTWPKEKETQQSIVTVIPHLINAGRATVAAEFVQRIAEESPSRGEYELITGQSLWGAYRELQNSVRGSDQADTPETQKQLTELSDLAAELLKAGYDRLPEEPTVNVTSATALLSLAQVYAEQEKFAESVEVLEHKKLGPMTLVTEGSSAAANPVFVEETFRTALQAYVAELGSGKTDVMEKTQNVIAAMRTSMGEDAAGQKRMMGVYVGLAQNVQKRMSSASPESKQQLSAVFESFLLELSSNSDDLSVLKWVADTFAQMAESFDGDADPNAQKYDQLAATALQKVLDHQDITPTARTQTWVRMGNVNQRLGNYPAALEMYTKVLDEKSNTINVQVSTANVLQAWGKQEPKRFQQAISGIKPNVWGWGKIASAASQNEDFRDIFFQARFEVSSCMLSVASTKAGAEQKSMLFKAEQNLTRTATLYPDMGTWRAKYDALLKQIQSKAGKKATGLKSL